MAELRLTPADLRNLAALAGQNGTDVVVRPTITPATPGQPFGEHRLVVGLTHN